MLQRPAGVEADDLQIKKGVGALAFVTGALVPEPPVLYEIVYHRGEHDPVLEPSASEGVSET